MSAYHQMGHDSQNLLGEVSGYRGAIVSPVNETESDALAMIAEHGSDTFEFILDPQLYFPQRGDRGQLSSWNYFPSDFDTADMSSAAWWRPICEKLAATGVRLDAKAICSPALYSEAALTNEYYEAMRGHASTLVATIPSGGPRVLQTVLVRLADLTERKRVQEIASVVSSTKAEGVYLVFLSDVKPRLEIRNEEQLKGAMRLIAALEKSSLPVLVGCCSTDVVLWKAAGATSCATGKFANLRRFTPGRFGDSEDGGKNMAYWLEDALIAFIRGSDIARIQPHGMGAPGDNPFCAKILAQFASDPGKPWVGLGWRQYMAWFANMEHRLSMDPTQAKALIRAAEKRWATLEGEDVFMEEKHNDGEWLRPWLRAVVEFST